MKSLRCAYVLLAFAVVLCTGTRIDGAPIYPLKQSANGRYLVDQANAPCLLLGDSPQALIVNLTEAEAAAFFADRSALGFNTLWINLLCATYTGGRADGTTLDGIRPFAATLPGRASYDLSTPNEAYFAHVDRVLALAAQQGLQILLDPIETGSWLSVMRDNGTNACRAFGQYLGLRYRQVDNLIWMSGNDFQDWRTASSDAVVRAVALGIRDVDSRHLHTLELDYLVSSSVDDVTWSPILTLNATYTYYPTYAQLLKDYQRTGLPSFMVEANYEFEHDWTGNETLRRQEYWTMLSGAAGQLYGNGYTWPFASGWQDHLDTPGATQLGYLKPLFEPRAWPDLVPDLNHTLLTSGYGTFTNRGSVNDSDYATAAGTTNGTLVMAYLPTPRTVTLDLTRLSAPASAHWYDPSSGTYAAIVGSPFPNTGWQPFTPPNRNSDGDGDWVLVLETHPPPIPIRPALAQQNYATPQTPQTSVTLAYPSPQSAGNANLVAIGWNDTSASISAINDSSGNVYRAAVPTYRGNGLSQAIYYAADIHAGSNAVTVTFNQPAVYVDLRATEYSGLSRTNLFDAGTSASGNGTPADSGAIDVSATNELLFAAGITTAVFTGAGSGFGVRLITTPDGDLVEDFVTPAPGSYRATASLTSGAWVMQLAAFRPAEPELLAPRLRASLTATNTVVLAWPASSGNFLLERNSELGGTNWARTTNHVDTAGAENRVIIAPPTEPWFFRLRQAGPGE